MLEIRTTSEEVWVGNGRRAVKITNSRLEYNTVLEVVKDTGVGDVIETFYELAVGDLATNDHIPMRPGTVILHETTGSVYLCVEGEYSATWLKTGEGFGSMELPAYGNYKILQLGD